MGKWVMRHRAFLVVVGVILLMTSIPAVHAWLFVGDAWQGVPPAYGDEILYHSQVHEVADGYPGYGNPYAYEHRTAPPLVIFAGNWIAAVPLMLGAPLFTALMINFIIWSVILAVLTYWLLREFGLPRSLSAVGTWLVYALSFALMYRPTSRQEVYPVFILFYIALARLLTLPNRTNTILLGIATGLSFWVFGYLWQTCLITLGFLLLYAWYRREWSLLRATLTATLIGSVLGSPVLFYTYQMTLKPYFWESISRLGLVYTHLPMAEVIYSGGWVGISIIFVGFMYWRSPGVRTYRSPALVAAFVLISGLGLWVMEGSNLITGKLLETGEHMRPFILPWLGIVLPLCGYMWWRFRAELSVYARLSALTLLILLTFGTGYFLYNHVSGFALRSIDAAFWREQQTYAAPLRWLDEREEEPVVIWANPHAFLVAHIPTLSRHYPLHTEASIFTLLSNEELRERYLVASYFDPVTTDYLKQDMARYLGRQDLFHIPKTIERGIKVCRILHFYDSQKNCGTPPTPIELKGEDFFSSMEKKFRTEIHPNIAEYQKKYPVSYLIKDKKSDLLYNPGELGAQRVYDDGRYEIYAFPK